MTTASAAAPAAGLSLLFQRSSIAVLGAWIATLVGFLVAPFVVLVLLVAVVVVLGMIAVGRGFLQTVDAIAAMDDF